MTGVFRLPVHLELRTLAGRGRGLFWSGEELDNKTVVFREAPLAVTSAPLPTSLRLLDDALRQSSERRNLSRLALRICSSVAQGSIDTWDIVRHLVRPRSVPIDQELLSAMHAAAPETEMFNEDRFAELMGALQLNSYRLPDDESALFASGSLLNHSCLPNIAVANAEGTFVAIENILPGDELCVAYCDVEMDNADRREYLRYNYGFWCECPRCSGCEFQAGTLENQEFASRWVGSA